MKNSCHKKLFFMFAIFFNFLLGADYRVQVFIGDDASIFREIISQQVLEAFAEYPYLYAGTLEEDIAYFNTWITFKDSALAVVFENDIPVASMKGYPLDAYLTDTRIRNTFLQQRLSISDFYYLTDLAVCKEHRGNYVSVMLMHALEEFAKNKGYYFCCLTTQKGDKQNPFRPAYYTDRTYYYMEYSPTSLYNKKTWPTLQWSGEIEICEHVLQFWFKALYE